jgi:hypothetical protein
MVGMVSGRLKAGPLASRSDVARKQVLAYEQMLRLLT